MVCACIALIGCILFVMLWCYGVGWLLLSMHNVCDALVVCSCKRSCAICMCVHAMLLPSCDCRCLIVDWRADDVFVPGVVDAVRAGVLWLILLVVVCMLSMCLFVVALSSACMCCLYVDVVYVLCIAALLFVCVLLCFDVLCLFR